MKTTTVLPKREGDRPETGPAIPHVQLTQNSPAELTDRLKAWMTTNLPDTVTGPSGVSDPGALAFHLDGTPPAPGAVLMPPSRVTEFVHVHVDGSLHMSLSYEDQQELVEKGWGERHPLYSPGTQVVMLYGPRTEEELTVAQTFVLASWRYATGR